MASVPENQVTFSHTAAEHATAEHTAAEHAAAEINALIRAGRDAGASDIHLEPDLPAAYRVSCGLVASKKHMSRDETLAISRLLLSNDQWKAFLKKGSAFPAEIQSSVAAQLGNALGAIVSQRLPFHKDLGIRIPECEILRTTPGVKNDIRRGEYAQITNAMEMGAESGMWTFDRYCEWVAARSNWYIPPRGPHGTAAEPSAS